MIFASGDCGEKDNVFGWAIETTATATSARKALERARQSVPPAYLKHCQLLPDTLLALGFTVIDPSVDEVPADAVNWSDDDRVSSVITLPNGRSVVIARYFVSAADDALDGRRARLVLVEATGGRTTLIDPCLGAGGIEGRRDRIAFHCAREQAADQDLHSTFVFSVEGKQLAEVERCSAPHWISDKAIRCSQESIGDDGLLKLQMKRVHTP